MLPSRFTIRYPPVSHLVMPLIMTSHQTVPNSPSCQRSPPRTMHGKHPPIFTSFPQMESPSLLPSTVIFLPPLLDPILLHLVFLPIFKCMFQSMRLIVTVSLFTTQRPRKERSLPNPGTTALAPLPPLQMQRPCT